MCWRLIELNKAAGEQCQGRTKPLTRLCSFLWEFKDFCKKRKLFLTMTSMLPYFWANQIIYLKNCIETFY